MTEAAKGAKPLMDLVTKLDALSAEYHPMPVGFEDWGRISSALRLATAWLEHTDDESPRVQTLIERDALKAENERLRRALEFYSHHDPYKGTDGGMRAREALQEPESEKPDDSR